MLLRRTFLFLSRRKTLRRWVETSSLTGPLTSRFVAGKTLDDAIKVCRHLEKEKILVTLDHLGENVTTEAEARRSRDAILEALDRLASAALPATVSIKLTQFGLDLSDELCRNNVDALVHRAADCGTAVEFDMESHEYTTRTLAIVGEMHRRYGRVRSVIQAYLRRSEDDVRRLNAERIPVRLCKGAYNEPDSVAFPSKEDVDNSYLHLTRLLLDEGVRPAIASHDERMVQAALEHARRQNIGADRFEFQMLYGIRRDLQKELVEGGYTLRLYVPYGDAWYPYFMRRLAERPANVLFLAKNLLRA